MMKLFLKLSVLLFNQIIEKNVYILPGGLGGGGGSGFSYNAAIHSVTCRDPKSLGPSAPRGASPLETRSGTPGVRDIWRAKGRHPQDLLGFIGIP